MFDWIDVSYRYYTTMFSISKALKALESYNILSFDIEAQPIYTLEERAEAKLLLKDISKLSEEDIRLTKLVANSSGLSHPLVVKTTHLIFGLSNKESVIMIINDSKTEQLVMDWVVNYKGKLLIHNSLYDLKLVHNRTGKFPIDYEDTQVLAKCILNNTNDWDARVGLKHLTGQYYNPKWAEIETYDIIDYKNEAFLRYSAIDGAATFLLWEQLQGYLNESDT